MNASIVYDFHWKSIPMGAIKNFKDWYEPYLGSGVYMLVLATTDDRYVGFYVGKSDDIGRRWRQHVRDWFVAPHDGYWLPVDAGAFLDDPVDVINSAAFKQGIPDRTAIQARILDQTWFAFAELRTIESAARLEHFEYVLQEALKKHANIQNDGYIGDAGIRRCPTFELTIRNHFGRCFLHPTLPHKICFEPERGIR